MDTSRIELLKKIRIKMSEWKKVKESKRIESYTVEECNLLKEINALILRYNDIGTKKLERTKMSYTPKQISSIIDLVNEYIRMESK